MDSYLSHKFEFLISQHDPQAEVAIEVLKLRCTVSTLAPAAKATQTRKLSEISVT